MYYEEKTIDGVLYYRTQPDAQFRIKSEVLKDAHARIAELEDQLRDATAIFDVERENSHRDVKALREENTRNVKTLYEARLCAAKRLTDARIAHRNIVEQVRSALDAERESHMRTKRKLAKAKKQAKNVESDSCALFTTYIARLKYVEDGLKAMVTAYDRLRQGE